MRRLPAAVACALLLVGAALVEGRPGSGQSYSGSSSSGSSSSGSSSDYGSSDSSSSYGGSSSSGGGSVSSSGGFGSLVIVVLVVLALSLMESVKNRQEDEEWSADARARAVEVDRTDYLALLRTKDPSFSLSLFEDFVRALYVRAVQARHDDPALARLAPYLTPAARRQLRGDRVDTVIIGSVAVQRWNLDQASRRFVATVAIEANHLAAGQTRLVRETWTFERSARVVTTPWEGTRTFGCPSCGAPLEQVAEELCASCGQEIRPGRFDWMACTVEEGVQEVTAGTGLTGTVEERGTDQPTVVAGTLGSEKASLLADDPQALTGFEARVQLVFSELNVAWATQDLRPARPFLTASLYATLESQLRPYVAGGLVNEVEHARIVRTEHAKLVRDPRQDALTIRLFGNGRDVTYRKDTGEVVGGSRTVDRPYSEYWTFIRGHAARGAPRAEKTCPRCAAPLQVGMEGNCEHCGALVASGEFDWVLSAIEQDDAYRG